MPVVAAPPAERPAGLSLWPADACLASELADELATLADPVLRHCHVVLPTQRLGTWLLALLSQVRAAFLPPRTFTFEAYIAAQAARLGVGAELAPPLSDLEQELLLATLLKAAGYRHLRLGHEHEIKQVFAELAEWDIGDAAFARLAELVAGNVYLSDGGLDTLSERFAELADLYQAFHLRAAADFGAEPAARRLGRLSAGLADALAGGAELGAPRLYLVGFTSAGGMHRRLLAALAARRETRIWLSELPPPALGEAAARHDAAAPAGGPLALLRTMLGGGGVARRARHVRPPRPLLVHRADTVLGEVADALTLAREAIGGGVPPSGVALLVSNDAIYGKPLRALLKGSGLSPNLALGTPLGATLAGSWLTCLLELVASDAGLVRVLAFAAHPLTLAWWRRIAPEAAPRAGGTALSATGLGERLSRQLCAAGVGLGLGAMAAAPGLDSDLRALLTALARVLGPLADDAPGDAGSAALSLPLAAWAEQLAGVAEAFDLAAAAGDDEDVGLANSARDAVQTLLAALARVGARQRSPLLRGELLSLVRGRLAGLAVRSVGDPLRGVQVLSIAEARYVPFELAIILGCTEGDFPRGLPQDHLVDNYLKTRIGLPGWHLLEAIEDTTFALLRARLPATALLYPAERGGELCVRSRFIEAALARGEAREVGVTRDRELMALLEAPGVGRTGRAALAAPEERAARRHGPQGVVALGAAQPLLAELSASSLENLLRCPYRFLLTRLGVAPTELPKDDDARREGDWLHDVLECFFTGAVGPRAVAGPLDAEVAWDAFRAYALARLGLLTDRLAPPGVADSPLALHLRLAAWPAFVGHLMRVYTPQTLPLAAVGWREKALRAEGGDALRVSVDGQAVTLRGSIDSVERLPELHVITDYKRSGMPAPGAAGSGLSPQLLVYAEAAQAMGDGALPLARAVVGYWSILKGAWLEVATGAEAAGPAAELGLTKPRPHAVTLEAAVERMRELWAWRQAELSEAGATFAADPSACGFCRFTSVCRRDDPELGPAVLAQARLATRLGQAGAAGAAAGRGSAG